MYMMYVDEAGDPGLSGSPTPYFALSGLVVHELRWLDSLDSLVAFRRTLKQRFGLNTREEIHAGDWINAPNPYVRAFPRSVRFHMLSVFARHLASMTDLTIINVVVDKTKRAAPFDVFDFAWTLLLQRFENTVASRNFNGPANADERGLLFADRTNEPKLRRLLRKMRRFNYVLSRFAPQAYQSRIKMVLEDPTMKDSDQSLMLQATDLAVFLLYQHFRPCQFMRQRSRTKLLNTLSGLFCLAAAPKHPLGIVLY